MTPPRRPQPHLVEDGYLVEPEPVPPPAPLSLVRWGCGVCLGIWLLALALLGSSLLDATPRSAANPTGSQPGASGAIGSVDASARVQAAASGLPPTGAPHDPGLQSAAAPSGNVGAPQAAGAIGTALVGGWATYCKPTATRCQSWGPPALVAAMPGFAGQPVQARVCTDVDDCVQVTVVSSCACGDRHGRPTVIDLSPAAFARLAPLGHGIVLVTVEWPVAPLPATDVEP